VQFMEQRSPRVRWLVIFLLAVVWVGAVLGRLTYLQLLRHHEYQARAQRQQLRIRETTPRRGSIFDRNGRELAVSVLEDYCFADRAEVSDPAMVSRLLSQVLGVPPQSIQEKLADPHPFPKIARKLTPEVAERIEALNLRGIYVQKEPVRVYPGRTLASHVLGYVDPDERGLGGIEYALDKQIRGKPGHVLVTKDARRRGVDRNESAALPGMSVTLTIDENIQYIAEKELAAAMEKTHAKSGSVVVEDPSTGEILAMANWPTFDANDASSVPDDARMNRAIAAAYEPGSTFKVITMASAIENGVTRPEDSFDCQMGSINVFGRIIHDWHPFGVLTVAQILAHSSDVGSIKVALKDGPARLYQTARDFGIGEPTEVDLPGENRGLFRPLQNWSANSIGSIAIGQEVSVTPLRIATVVGAIANGGTLYRPHVIKKTGGKLPVSVQEVKYSSNSSNDSRSGSPSSGSPSNDSYEVRRALSASTAATIREMMEGVVLEGTGKPARLAGFTDGGKSGTAQKIDPATGRYSPNQYVASFVGFAPVNEPAVAIAVVLDSPIGAHHGGDVGGPVFKAVAEQVLDYLNVPEDVPVAPEGIAKGRVVKAELRRAQGHSASGGVTGDGGKGVEPQAAEANKNADGIASGDVAKGDASGAGSGTLTVPSFQGKSVREVTEDCTRLGLELALVGNGVAISQSPEAGSTVKAGARVTVQFGRAAAVVPVSTKLRGVAQ
jgi:cell division protein FtsI (penicillin-binding protein 3)